MRPKHLKNRLYTQRIGSTDVELSTSLGDDPHLWTRILQVGQTAYRHDVAQDLWASRYGRQRHFRPAAQATLGAMATALALRGPLTICPAMRDAVVASGDFAWVLWSTARLDMPTPSVRRLAWQSRNMESHIRTSIRLVIGLVACGHPSWSDGDTTYLADMCEQSACDDVTGIMHHVKALEACPHAEQMRAMVRRILSAHTEILQRLDRDDVTRSVLQGMDVTPQAWDPRDRERHIDDDHLPNILTWLQAQPVHIWQESVVALRHESVQRDTLQHMAMQHGVASVAGLPMGEPQMELSIYLLLRDPQRIARCAAAHPICQDGRFLAIGERIMADGDDDSGAACRWMIGLRSSGLSRDHVLHTASMTAQERLRLLWLYTEHAGGSLRSVQDLVGSPNDDEAACMQALAMLASLPTAASAMIQQTYHPALMTGMMHRALRSPHGDRLRSIIMRTVMGSDTTVSRMLMSAMGEEQASADAVSSAAQA